MSQYYIKFNGKINNARVVEAHHSKAEGCGGRTMANNTAYRPSQSHREFVKNSRGETVRNLAYTGKKNTTGGVGASGREDFAGELPGSFTAGSVEEQESGFYERLYEIADDITDANPYSGGVVFRAMGRLAECEYGEFKASQSPQGLQTLQMVEQLQGIWGNADNMDYATLGENMRKSSMVVDAIKQQGEQADSDDEKEFYRSMAIYAHRMAASLRATGEAQAAAQLGAPKSHVPTDNLEGVDDATEKFAMNDSFLQFERDDNMKYIHDGMHWLQEHGSPEHWTTNHSDEVEAMKAQGVRGMRVAQLISYNQNTYLGTVFPHQNLDKELSKAGISGVRVDAFENNREHGLVYTVNTPTGEHSFSVYEHRNSDDIIINGCKDWDGVSLPYKSDDKSDYYERVKFRDFDGAARELVHLMGEAQRGELD